jgi:hypothetical protein
MLGLLRRSPTGMTPSIIALVGLGLWIVGFKVLAATSAHGALRCWNRFDRLSCFNRLNYGLAFRSRRFGLLGGGFLLFHRRRVLLHNVSAVLFDKLLTLNWENHLSGSGHPDRHAASGRHVFLSRRFCGSSAWIHRAGCLSEHWAAHQEEEDNKYALHCVISNYPKVCLVNLTHLIQFRASKTAVRNKMSCRPSYARARHGELEDTAVERPGRLPGPEIVHIGFHSKVDPMDDAKDREIIRLWNQLRLLKREGPSVAPVLRQIKKALAERERDAA